MAGFEISQRKNCTVLQLKSSDGTNRLSRAVVEELALAVGELASSVPALPLIVTGNEQSFSAGADLNEIAALSAATAFDFARMGQRLMESVAHFPAPTIAAISGYCMGGGLDLALACDLRVAGPHAVFGHRGAALGVMTGWGGTQRLPRLIGKGRALQMFCAAEKVGATRAFEIGLVHEVADDPLARAMQIAESIMGRLS
jgi:enoyl-CoA hydratase